MKPTLTEQDYLKAAQELGVKTKLIKELSPLDCRAKPIMVQITDEVCWEVVSHKVDKTGYVILCRNHKRVMAHRLSYEIFKGPISEGMCACHRCDNRKCINPDHLFEGTYKENTRDMIAKKGRFSTKLSIEKVKEIRSIYHSKNISCRKLSQIYGVSCTCINEIVKNVSWVGI